MFSIVFDVVRYFCVKKYVIFDVIFVIVRYWVFQNCISHVIQF